jgi:hypothetical protein
MYLTESPASHPARDPPGATVNSERVVAHWRCGASRTQCALQPPHLRLPDTRRAAAPLTFHAMAKPPQLPNLVPADVAEQPL